jgi:hypothetical protein
MEAISCNYFTLIPKDTATQGKGLDKSDIMFAWEPPRQPAAQAAILTAGSQNRMPVVSAHTRQGCLEANQTAPKDPFN